MITLEAWKFSSSVKVGACFSKDSKAFGKLASAWGGQVKGSVGGKLASFWSGSCRRRRGLKDERLISIKVDHKKDLSRGGWWKLGNKNP